MSARSTSKGQNNSGDHFQYKENFWWNDKILHNISNRIISLRQTNKIEHDCRLTWETYNCWLFILKISENVQKEINQSGVNCIIILSTCPNLIYNTTQHNKLIYNTYPKKSQIQVVNNLEDPWENTFASLIVRTMIKGCYNPLPLIHFQKRDHMEIKIVFGYVLYVINFYNKYFIINYSLYK